MFAAAAFAEWRRRHPPHRDHEDVRHDEERPPPEPIPVDPEKVQERREAAAEAAAALQEGRA
jgi:hypothetical protein